MCRDISAILFLGGVVVVVILFFSLLQCLVSCFVRDRDREGKGREGMLNVSSALSCQHEHIWMKRDGMVWYRCYSMTWHGGSKISTEYLMFCGSWSVYLPTHLPTY